MRFFRWLYQALDVRWWADDHAVALAPMEIQLRREAHELCVTVARRRIEEASTLSQGTFIDRRGDTNKRRA